jgi:hypothetical protein
MCVCVCVCVCVQCWSRRARMRRFEPMLLAPCVAAPHPLTPLKRQKKINKKLPPAPASPRASPGERDRYKSIYLDRHVVGEKCDSCCTGLSAFKLSMQASTRRRRRPHACSSCSPRADCLQARVRATSKRTPTCPTLSRSPPVPSSPPPRFVQYRGRPSSSLMRVTYSCNSLNKLPTGAPARYSTPANDWGGGNTGARGRGHGVRPGVPKPLVCAANALGGGLLACPVSENLRSIGADCGGVLLRRRLPAAVFFDRHDIRCPANHILHRWKLYRPATNQARPPRAPSGFGRPGSLRDGVAHLGVGGPPPPCSRGPAANTRSPAHTRGP